MDRNTNVIENIRPEILFLPSVVHPPGYSQVLKPLRGSNQELLVEVGRCSNSQCRVE